MLRVRNGASVSVSVHQPPSKAVAVAEAEAEAGGLVYDEKGRAFFPCPLCCKAFSGEARRDQHVMASHREDSQPETGAVDCTLQIGYPECNLCHVSFATHKQLRAHNDEQHPNECTTCRVHFLRKALLVAHNRRHHRVRKVVVSRQRMAHFDEVFQRSDQRLCPICLRAPGKSWQKHRLVHLDERVFSCAFCTKRFLRKDHLKTHMRLHLKQS